MNPSNINAEYLQINPQKGCLLISYSIMIDAMSNHEISPRQVIENYLSGCYPDWKKAYKDDDKVEQDLAMSLYSNRLKGEFYFGGYGDLLNYHQRHYPDVADYCHPDGKEMGLKDLIEEVGDELKKDNTIAMVSLVNDRGWHHVLIGCNDEKYWERDPICSVIPDPNMSQKISDYIIWHKK